MSMSYEVTSDYRSSTAQEGGSVSGTPTSDSMANTTAVIASATVVCLILVAVGITVLLFCLYRRRKRASSSIKAEDERPKRSHGSSTMRSDESDHPYENPSLPRNLRAKQSSKPGGGRNSGPYVSLRGHSLPHHYQGLGQNPQLLDESGYDELRSSMMSEGTNSDYYFKLESGSRNNSVIRPDARPGFRPGIDPTATDSDEAYDLVEVGNMTKNNANQSEALATPKGSGEGAGGNPYYFKVERSKGGSLTLPASFHDSQPPNDKPLPSPKGDGANAKPKIAAKPHLATTSSVKDSAPYDKLDRSPVSPKKAEDINANEYDKLLPGLAGQPSSSDPTSSDGYLKVKVGNGVSHLVDADNDDGHTEVDDYNKLDRGVEKEIRQPSRQTQDAANRKGQK